AMKTLRETQFAGLTPSARGKVRDIYDLGDKLLIVATDRLSAFDVVMPTPIPDKGKVLTQLSLFWFDLLKDVISNHVLSATELAAVMIVEKLAAAVRGVSIASYVRAAEYAAPRGILLADTKFEFGLLNGELIWIDEALTP